MIVVDIETSGISHMKCGIWQIGAVDFENQRFFLEEARIDDDDVVIEEALSVFDKTEAYLRDRKKQSQKQLLIKFFNWCEKSKIHNFMCENPQFDVAFLQIKSEKYGIKFPFHHRAFDLHSITSARYLQLNKKILIKDNRSDMGVYNTLEFCGMKDERRQLKDGKIVKEGKPHNALEDAKLTAECFSRLLYGKNLLPEYKKFPVPKYLKIN